VSRPVVGADKALTLPDTDTALDPLKERGGDLSVAPCQAPGLHATRASCSPPPVAELFDRRIGGPSKELIFWRYHGGALMRIRSTRATLCLIRIRSQVYLGYIDVTHAHPDFRLRPAYKGEVVFHLYRRIEISFIRALVDPDR